MAHEFYRQWEGPVNLDNCAREPISTPGAIQPFAVLLKVSERGRVLVASEGAGVRLAGLDAEAVGSNLETLFDRESQLRLMRAVLVSEAAVEVVSAEGEAWTALTHRSGTGCIIELEPVPEGDSGASYDAIRRAVRCLRRCDSVVELCHEMAGQVRQLTGYDRAMVYRFDEDDHGQVIAEAVSPGTDGRYLHQHFPEADIPAQARALYVRQLCRMIVDAEYTPVHLHPAVDEEGRPVDLSLAVSRSVSPIHCEYLKNMGVAATLTLSIVEDGRLWGLIACHHYGPRYVEHALRDLCCFLVEVFTWQLRSLLREEVAQAEARALFDLQGPLARISDAETFSAGMVSEAEQLMTITATDGIAVVGHDRVETFGACPTLRDTRRIAKAAEQMDGLVLPLQVAEAVSGCESLTGPGAGACVLKLDPDASTLVILFRNEYQHERWYGSPLEKKLEVTDQKVRLTPAGSQAAYREVIQQRSRPWGGTAIAAARTLQRGLLRAQARHAARLAARNRELMEASAQKDMFLATLSHELRNPLNALVGWSGLMAQGKVPEEKVEVAVAAIHRNAMIQKRLIDDLLDVSAISNGKLELRMEVTTLDLCVRSAVEVTRPMFDSKGVSLIVRIYEGCGPVEGDPHRIQQIMWNYLANAAKYTPAGGHVVARLFPERSRVVFEVQDDGVGIAKDELVRVFERFHQVDRKPGTVGLGLGLSIVKGLAELHGATVRAESHGPGKGSRFRVAFPAALNGGGPEISLDEVGVAGDSLLEGIRAVVVDDLEDAAALLRAALEDQGAEVYLFTEATRALTFIRSQADAINVVVSDINMPEVGGHALAARIRADPAASHIALVAVTAYAGARDRISAFRAGFQAHISKPVDIDEFIAMVAALTQGRS